MLLRTFLILMVSAYSYNAFAGCTEPVEPECASNEDTFKNKGAYANCSAEFKNMNKQTKEYVDCLSEELKKATEDAQKKADAATAKTKSSLEKFNCKADPKATC